ncbi:MAG TPA: polyphosphate kinase 2 family protein [Draconibacterium sp.]|nr:polyphosphate kinase 2 family protein [Draconibacterium sp.]
MKKSLISRKELDSLSHKELIERAKDFAKQYCVGDGKNFSLKNYPTDDYPELKKNEKQIFKDLLQMGVETLASMQDKMYAQDKWSLLIIFQAMDAAGKDGAIKHVMSGLNPQGCEVNSFKAPSAEEIDHDFLWRCAKRLPERGRIGIFNRSYYEEVLVVRVHQQILQAQKIPEKLITEDIWDERFQDIRNFEEHLHRNGTIIIKFFLNISPDEQKKRFIERIDNPDKNWKFSASDAKERKYWNDYMNAYEQLIINTSTENSPWYVIPADDKPYARIAVAAAIISAMDSMDLKYPEVSAEKIAELQKIREELMVDE